MPKSSQERGTLRSKFKAYKSRFFSSSEVNEQFRDEFDLLLELPPDKLEIMLGEAPTLITSDHVEGGFDALAEKVGFSSHEVFHCLRVIRYIVLAFQENPPGTEEASLWAADYIRFADRDPGDAPKIGALVSRLLGMAKLTLQPVRSQNAARKVFPFLEETFTAVELRSVFRSDYSDRESDQKSVDVAQYVPQLIGLVPVTSVSLIVDIGSDFQFQVDEDGLRKLLRTLLAALRDLEATKAAANIALPPSHQA
jgi:hypothetical protein